MVSVNNVANGLVFLDCYNNHNKRLVYCFFCGRGAENNFGRRDISIHSGRTNAGAVCIDLVAVVQQTPQEERFAGHCRWSPLQRM
jgi:hypothetical protein